jgi:hypothetical protein
VTVAFSQRSTRTSASSPSSTAYRTQASRASWAFGPSGHRPLARVLEQHGNELAAGAIVTVRPGQLRVRTPGATRAMLLPWNNERQRLSGSETTLVTSLPL